MKRKFISDQKKKNVMDWSGLDQSIACINQTNTHTHLQLWLNWWHQRRTPYRRWLEKPYWTCSSNKSREKTEKTKNKYFILLKKLSILKQHSKMLLTPDMTHYSAVWVVGVCLGCNVTSIMLPRHSCSPCWQVKTYFSSCLTSWNGIQLPMMYLGTFF